jgi:hypothetical protein
MDRVLRYIEQRAQRLHEHRLFDWFASEDVTLSDRLAFLPRLASFVMGFRDINKWVLRYPFASDELERGINLHTFEDQTHSRLFLEDWRKLGLDDRLGDFSEGLDDRLEDLGDGRTKVVNVSLFHTTEERDGMLSSGMEEGLNQSYAALDLLLAKPD